MSFQGLVLDGLRRQAGLLPMPDFIRAYGEPLPDQGWEEFIDSRYFSPEAKYYMSAALKYQAKGMRLKADDLECISRIWIAVGELGCKARAAQEDRFRLKQKFKAFNRLMPIALEREMRKRGYHYGPDYELPDDVEIPSAQEVTFRYVASKVGVSVGAVKSWYYRTLKSVGTH